MFLLASNSPRRKQLLTEAGYIFECEAHSIDESIEQDLSVKYVAEKLAIRKNNYHRDLYPQKTIITADTTVIFQDQLLEKPSDLADAKRMLKQLSGNRHEVYSGVCVSDSHVFKSFSVKSEVYFDYLSDDEIDYYVSKYQPLDKAGAYGIQEWIGMIGIKKIVGSYYNVAGLPLHELYLVLKNDFQINPH